MIKLKIHRDSSAVAKIVVIDNEGRVLFLERSKYHKKHAGELDLPGGHVKEQESILKGLERELYEETGLRLDYISFFKQIGNKHYFHARYNSQPIKLSDEHTDYGFYDREQLNSKEKFQKVAIEVLEILKNG
ncbi:MAG: hypothetical protein CL532_00780 [Aestuariivita sp.]|nr:hypothetical protein [Aestuariivita sp.]